MIEICPEAMSAIILGMKKGLNRGPFLFLSQGVFADLFFEGMDTADAHSEYHADVVFVDRFEVQTAVLYSLHCRHDCILFIEIHLRISLRS